MMSIMHISSCHCQKADEGSSPKCIGEHLPSDDSSVPSSNFECSICLELSQDPVVTMCGHLFCWSCLHKWITIHSTFQECPVCKACVTDKIIPLYGKGMGFADSETKKVHKFNIPRPPPPAQRSCVTAANMPSSSGFQHHRFISHENHSSRGGQVTYSAASFGLFPALFGFHILALPDYGSGFSSGTTYNAASGRMTSQQQHLNAQQEFALYWFLILLACFTILCFLLF